MVVACGASNHTSCGSKCKFGIDIFQSKLRGRGQKLNKI